MIPNLPHSCAFRLFQQSSNPRHLLQGSAQCQTVTGIHALVSHLAQQPFHVIDPLQLLGKGHGQHVLMGEFFHGVQSAVDGRFVHERLFDPAPQQPSTHGGGGFIHQPQERAFLGTVPQAFRQFQIAPGIPIQQHGFRSLINPQSGDVLQRILLGVAQVMHQGSCRTGTGTVFLRQPQGRQILQGKMLAQGFRRILILEAAAAFLRGRNFLPQVAGMELHQVGGNDFDGADPCHLVRQGLLRMFHLMDKELTSGHVCKG